MCPPRAERVTWEPGIHNAALTCVLWWWDRGKVEQTMNVFVMGHVRSVTFFFFIFFFFMSVRVVGAQLKPIQLPLLAVVLKCSCYWAGWMGVTPRWRLSLALCQSHPRHFKNLSCLFLFLIHQITGLLVSFPLAREEFQTLDGLPQNDQMPQNGKTLQVLFN